MLGPILSICCPLFFFCNVFLFFGRPLDIRKHLIKTIRLFVLAIKGVSSIWKAVLSRYDLIDDYYKKFIVYIMICLFTSLYIKKVLLLKQLV